MDKQSPFVWELPADPEARALELFQELHWLADALPEAFLLEQVQSLIPKAQISIAKPPIKKAGRPPLSPGIYALIYWLIIREQALAGKKKLSIKKAAENLAATGFTVRTGNESETYYKASRYSKEDAAKKAESIRQNYIEAKKAIKAVNPTPEQSAIRDSCHAMGRFFSQEARTKKL